MMSESIVTLIMRLTRERDMALDQVEMLTQAERAVVDAAVVWASPARDRLLGNERLWMLPGVELHRAVAALLAARGGNDGAE